MAATRCCHGLTVEGHLTQSPTPRRRRRPNHPNLITPLRVWDLNSLRSILVNNNTSSFALLRFRFFWFWALEPRRAEETGGAVALVPGVHHINIHAKMDIELGLEVAIQDVRHEGQWHCQLREWLAASKAQALSWKLPVRGLVLERSERLPNSLRKGPGLPCGP